MKTLRIGIFRSILSTAVLCAGLWLSFTSISVAQGNDSRTQDFLPAVCSNVEVPEGHKMDSRIYAVGIQRYRWNGDAWVFVEPVATLYADAKYHNKVGTHYAGPAWEFNNGGKVVAARLQGCSPNPTAIPWLLLEITTTNGPGILTSMTYIQRVNTVGGLAPTAPGASVGAVADVPYTAEYYFYRSKN